MTKFSDFQQSLKNFIFPKDLQNFFKMFKNRKNFQKFYLFFCFYKFLKIIKNGMGYSIFTTLNECLSHSNPAWYFNQTYIVLIVTVLIVMPLSTLKHIGFLGYTSGFSILVMVFFTIDAVFLVGHIFCTG